MQTTGFVNEENINPPGTWSLGLLQMDFYYRNKPWYAGQFVRKIIPKINIPEGAKLFFQTLLNMQKSALLQVLVRNVDEEFRNTIIQLPQTEEKEIDFGFMEALVSELETSCLHKLEDYLLVTGLENYELTSDDHAVLKGFNTLHWQKWRIGDLFEKLPVKKALKSNVRKYQNGEFCVPVVYCKYGDNGIMYWGRKGEFTTYENVLSVVYNGAIATGKVYAQQKSTGILAESYFIRFINKSSNHFVNLFCATILEKNLYHNYSRDYLATWSGRVENDLIWLPIDNFGEPDFEAMKRLIVALQKLVIADVAKYTSHRLEATRQIVESKTVDYDTHDVSDYWMAAEPFECYKWNRFDQSIIDFFGGDRTILVGCYKGKKHYDWIHAHNTYNIRLGKTKGSMEEKRDLFGKASLLVLYEHGKPTNLSAFKIVGHQEMNKEELQEMDYPKKNPRKSYMAFSIAPREMDLSFLIEHHLIERLVELNADNAKGTPVFIEP